MQIHVGTRKGLFTIDRGGRGACPWRIQRTAMLGDPVTMVLPQPARERLYAALDHGHFGVKLQRSDDRGHAWQEIAAPVYPPKPDGVEDLDPMRNEPVPWSLKLIWSLEAAPDNPDTLWCGTMPGGLFRSGDAGTSWTLVETLWDHPKRRQWFGGGADYPGIHSILIDPRDARRVMIAVSCGGVWASDDSGAIWQPRSQGMWAAYMPPPRRDDPEIQDPHRLVQCQSEPDTLWAQHHNGVFRSTDRGGTWHEVEDVQPSAFGFAVAVHPDDADTAWFVPALKDEKRYPADGALVVNRTRDGGRSFERLTDGLPQEHAYDLVFRHALAIEASGDHLAFGSTTGSFWVSEDQGDHWLLVSSHLPPVYCVRFENERA